jgi:hypothetical protein
MGILKQWSAKAGENSGTVIIRNGMLVCVGKME